MYGRWRALSAPTYSMLETLRQLEVELDGRDLPASGRWRRGRARDLGGVEGAPTLVDDRVVDAGVLQGGARSASVAPSHSSSRPEAFPRPGGQLGVEVVEPEVAAAGRSTKRQQAGQLGLHLLAGAEDVGVVLGHAPHPRQAR